MTRRILSNDPNALSPIDPKVDVAFKYLVSHNHILLGLVNDIFKASNLPHLKSIVPISGEMTPQNIMERGASLDLVGFDDMDRRINLEMQMNYHGCFIERLLFHWGKIHVAQFEKNTDFAKQKISPTVVIAISNFRVTQESDYLNAYKIMNTKTMKVLKKDMLNMIFLELPNIPEDPRSPEAIWGAFFTNHKKYKKIIEEYSMTQQAATVLSTMGVQDKFIDAYEANLQLMNDDESRMALTYVEAKEDGKIEGRSEGKIEGRSEFVKTLLVNGMSREDLLKFGGITDDELKSYGI